MHRSLALILLWSAAVFAQAPAAPVSPKDRAAFEAIIKDYLLKNPGIIREAIERLRAMEEAEQAQKVSAALSQNRASLLNDPDSPVAGNPKGDVTVVEFFDYNCGYCKKVAGSLLDLAARDPNVRIVYKEYPILGPESVEAARAALVAHKQGKYLAFHQAMMTGSGRGAQAIQAALTKAGVDPKQVAKETADPAITRIIERNQKLAAALEIQGTPAFIIGDQIVPGALSADSLAIMVKGERAKAAGQKTP